MMISVGRGGFFFGRGVGEGQKLAHVGGGALVPSFRSVMMSMSFREGKETRGSG